MNTTQFFAHRAQLAARNKPRWQPYSQTTSTLPTPNMNTPKPSSQPPPVTPLPNTLQYSSSNVFPQVSKDQPVQRDVYRHKFALGLIDQAVKILSEIWRPEDIPIAFIGPTKGASSTQTNPLPSLLISTGTETTSSMLPLKNFVHEVLKRSRTSGSILQTALCYLEAVRSRIPDISRDEKRGIRSYFMPESTILPATEAELEADKILTNLESQQPYTPTDDIVKTVDQSPDLANLPLGFDGLSGAPSVRVEPALSTVVSASLPSPLLCPRRTFLAALILASKFSQDKCYSNRAWAKLSGLPPREIGRCERALGQALDWRLWVGKKTRSSDPTASAAAGSVRTGTVGRTQSESCISLSPHKPFLQPATPSISPSISAATVAATTVAAGDGTQRSNGLRRCATLPAKSFASPNQWHPVSASALDSMSMFCIANDSTESINSDEIGDPIPRIVFPHATPESGSSNSSPHTPSLSYTPSTSGAFTVQMSSFEDGNFPSSNGSQPYLEITDGRHGFAQSASLFAFNPKVPTSAHIELAGKLAFEMAQLQAQIAVANAADLLGISPPGGYLLHADGSHVPLGLASVH